MRDKKQIDNDRKAVYKQFAAGRNGKPGAPKSAAEIKSALTDLDPTHVVEALKHFVQAGSLTSTGKGPATKYFRTPAPPKSAA